MKTIIYSIVILLFITGCFSTYPMGMDEDTWKKLPPKTKAELLQIEAEQKARQRELEEKLRHQERMKELEIAAKREARLERILKLAKYGDIVRVNISGGCIRIYKKCEPYRPISLLLVRGETKHTKLIMNYSSLELWVRYDHQGITIDDDQDLDDFDAAVYLPEHWERGKYYRLNLKEPYQKNPVIQNAKVYIRYLPTARTTSNCK
ncbi:hypothetical protein RZR97_12860 [Hydrogenimonas thermophila]|uniref:hypothetical protein n=1 Tax=Hydrogenimonas thermophila TaxID=223786 RepID=UPI002936DF7A|nr:hypothetical protein [Hydrogenimonas thermophila]WOE69972.1 hypothetical protein RZR91_12865 [Hydrogenimonas thermophila]WOE72489.1 hypothetical protein RZR97_12860 [Hydrogenimonas thermophila]